MRNLFKSRTINANMEYVPHVTSYDRLIGKIEKDKANDEVLWHRGVHIMVFNSKDEILVHKRSLKKKHSPGSYDAFFGGWVRYGETYRKAALRELHEETGIRIKRLKFLFKHKINLKDDKYFAKVYSIKHDGKFKFSKSEVHSASFMEVNKARKLLANENTQGSRKILFRKIFGK